MAANPGDDAEGVHSFEARLVRPEGVGTWTYFVIPLDLADLYGAKGTIQVRGTINGVSFRSAALPSGDGSHFVAVNKAIRDQIGAHQGDTVAVTLVRDDEPRTLSVPDDLRLALDAAPAAGALFSAFSYSHQREYLEWIASAKTEATRRRRIASAVEKIATRQRLK
jgi:Bacteriocin-protection, YdeI or OmpD-Associated/Domain of unknown function (DUF1905)